VNRAEVVWMLSTDGSDQADPLQWLAELTRRPEWHADAACRGADPAAFVLARGANAAVMARARAVCDRCTVTEECLAFALADPYAMGVWGGTTGRQRKLMRTGKVA
jgi:WhiB family redox-sensing transcriptional regulator